MGLRALHDVEFTCFNWGKVRTDGLKDERKDRGGREGDQKQVDFPDRDVDARYRGRERGGTGGWEVSQERQETLGWKLGSGYECELKGPVRDSQAGFKCTVYQRGFMLLVLSQASRDAQPLGVSFMCAA